MVGLGGWAEEHVVLGLQLGLIIFLSIARLVDLIRRFDSSVYYYNIRDIYLKGQLAENGQVSHSNKILIKTSIDITD